MVDTLHLNTSIVSDPFAVSNPIGGTAHLSMIFRGLRISILALSLSAMHMFLALWAMA